jgi:glycosyltransferase involved in cell wall biosynthesis
MRVAVVAFETTHRTDRQGVARAESLARALARRGHDVTVFCTEWWYGPSAGSWRVDDDLRYRRIDIAPALGSSLARLPTLLAGFRPDVVHATPAPPSMLLAAKVGATLGRAPLVCDWYGDEPIDDGRLADAARRAPSRLLTPSRYVRARLATHGVGEERVTVLPEFIDFETVRAVEPAPDAPDVVAGRRLDAAANLESLFLGLAELREDDWTAAVVGDGPARAEFEQAAADLRIDDRVEFLGDIPREERVALYRGAQTFVHTATREEFPTELLWALACGCVGVVEYQSESAAHELVEGYERGFRATTSEEIADAVVEARSYGRRTVDESMARYDREQVVGRLLSTYRELGAGE